MLSIKKTIVLFCVLINASILSLNTDNKSSDKPQRVIFIYGHGRFSA